MKVSNSGTDFFEQFLLAVFRLVIIWELKMESNITVLMTLMLPIGIASFITGDSEPTWTKRLTAKI